MMDRAGGWQLSLQDWEQIFYDFKGRSRAKWLSQYPGLAILEQALYIVAKKDYPFKPQLLAFIEENIEILIGDDDAEEGLGSVVEALRTVLESPPDGLNATSLLKEQMMTTATVALVVLDSLHRALHQLQILVEVLLGVINRPNHGLDRQARGTACECLRELEKAYPCLLNACAGHILFLFQSERTHVAQSYTLLLTTILHNLACYMYTTPGSRSGGTNSFLSTSAPLTPFTVPFFLVSSDPGEEALSVPSKELTPGVLKEFRRVVGLLLERPQLLTSSGMLEFVSSLIDIAAALELQGSILKVQLYSLMYTYSPLLCHAVLMIYFHFMDAFDGEEGAIFKRLNLLCNDPHQPLMMRLLAVHWLLGLENLLLSKEKKPRLATMALSMYPLIYDPLSLKALKLDTLAHCAAFMCTSVVALERKQSSGVLATTPVRKEEVATRLFKDGAVCLLAFRWLPSWSSETCLMFRMLHRFLTVEAMRCRLEATDVEPFSSTLFKTLEARLVSLALQLRRLVPCLLMLVDRLLLCETHKALGQHLLQVFNKDLLSQVTPDKHLPAHFPILERIAENGSIPPGGIVDLLTAYARNQIAAVGTERVNLWIRGSQVLLICRTIMVHHYSSRAFRPLCNLLAYLVFYFPDIEVQDSARTYLRMLVSVPGKKLRAILKYGDERIEDPQFTQVSSLLQATPPSPGYKKPLQVASYIHLTRATALLVGQSWSLVLHNLYQNEEKATDESVDDETPVSREEAVPLAKIGPQEGGEDELLSEVDVVPATSDIKEDDTDSLKDVKILQEYFSLIPDYVNGSGLKVNVQCYLKFKADAQPSHREEDSPRSMLSGPSFSESWPALFAVVLSFSTSGPYGHIPSVHIPFLLSEPPDATKETADEGPSSAQLQIIQHQGETDVRAKLSAEEAAESKTTAQAAEVGLREEAAKDGMPELEGKEKSQCDTGPGSADGSSTSEQLDEDAFKESIVLALEPKQPVPTIIDTYVVTSDEDGRRIHGQLDSVHVGIEDLFSKALLPSEGASSDSSTYYFDLFNALWDACDRAGRLHTKPFALHGGKEYVSVAGTESVKLLESRADRVVDAVEHHLSEFVVSARGDQLVSILKDSGMLKDIIWQEDTKQGNRGAHLAITYGLPTDKRSNKLYDFHGSSDADLPPPEAVRENIGSLCILIFLPPRFHILLKMDIADWSTLVHIRTDYWPCLAYVDEYLEALVTSS